MTIPVHRKKKWVDTMGGSPRSQEPSPGAVPAKAGLASALHENRDVMSGHSYQRTVRITNPQGLHMRPISAFAEMASRFDCTVTVTKDGRRVNGKSPLELMFLAAEQGSELLLEASGSDAEAALDALAALLDRMPDEEPPDNPLPLKG